MKKPAKTGNFKKYPENISTWKPEAKTCKGFDNIDKER